MTPSTEANSKGQARIRDLIIEDESWFRSFVVPNLNANGFIVVAAVGTKTEALERIRQDEYDLVLVDIELDSNDTQGFSLIPEIRHARPDARIAIYSGYLDPESDLVRRARSQELSADGVLRKFMDVEEVHKALRSIMDNPGSMWIDPTLRRALPNKAVQSMTPQELEFLRSYARKPLERSIWARVNGKKVRDFDNRMQAVKRKILDHDLYPNEDRRTELSSLEVYEWARKRGLHFD